MGYGVAAAIGGKFAAPDRVVVSITGDGGFLMNGMEVSTAVHYNKQVIWVVLNDAGYGIVNYTLRVLKLPDVGTRYPRVDCAQVAEGLGAQAFRIREPGQINRQLIAEILETTVGAVESRLVRALRNLQRTLGPGAARGA